MTVYGTAGPHPENMVTGIAIGKDAYTRSGSVMVSTHNYNGQIGDITVNTRIAGGVSSNNKKTNATTVGTNSFNNASSAWSTGHIRLLRVKTIVKTSGLPLRGL